MKVPVQIVFRNMRKSNSVEQAVLKRVERLESFCDCITRCRVTIELPHRHHRQGNLFQVGIEISLPGKQISINRENEKNAEYKDFEVALRDAFDSARRKLEDYMRIRRREVKSHEAPVQAHISELFPENGYGFLETPDGEQIYFHANSLVNEQFNRLQIGRKVALVQEQGIEGPQASAVKVLEK